MIIKPSQGDARTLTTGNVGDGGVFLFAARAECLPVGTEIVVTLVKSADGTSPPPSIRGRVIHVSDKGMGSAFLEPSFS